MPSVILDTQMATKSDVFSSYFVYSVFIPSVTFLVELQIQLHTPVKSSMIIILLKINLLYEISIQLVHFTGTPFSLVDRGTVT